MKRARHLRMHHFRFRRPIRRGQSARVMWKFCRAALMGPSYFRRTGAYITWRRRTRLRYMNLWMRHRATVLGVASTESSKGGEPSSERVVLYVNCSMKKRIYILTSTTPDTGTPKTSTDFNKLKIVSTLSPHRRHNVSRSMMRRYRLRI